MHILITGNMGYVGPIVIRHLRATWPHATLTGFDAGFFAHALTAAPHVPETLLDRQIFGDIRDIGPDALAGVDAVVHLAALSNDPIGGQFERPTEQINARASLSLAEMARAAGVRAFVFASSCSVYGAAGEAARTETDPTYPLTAYARSKIATEDALRRMGAGDMVVTCLRFATACGMSDRLRLDLVLNDFVAGAVSGRQITVLSDGSPWRPLIEVSDMARAIEWAIGRAASSGGPCLVVNAGSESWNFQVRDLAEAVARAVPGTSVSINANAQPDKRSYRVDFSLFKSLAPHHQPIMTLPAAIERIRDGLARMNFADANFRGGKLIRLRVLEQLRADGMLTEDIRWRHDSALRRAA
jgi:nucleoside-diphosphate-sugar epimerase